MQYNIIILLNIILGVSSKCGIGKLPKKPFLFHDSYGINKRFLSSIDWQSIRIFTDYTHIESQLNKGQLDISYLNNIKLVFNLTTNILQELVNVKRIPQKLIIESCENFLISPIIQTVGTDSDLIIIPIIDNDAGEEIEAYASLCLLDETSNRPIAGYVGLNKNMNFTLMNSLNYYTMLLLHEINHILCMNYDLFEYFIDSNGKKLGLENVITTSNINGIERTLIKTPRVIETAKKHFGCRDVIGVELENQGGDATAKSHWESRIMFGDFMIGASVQENVISEISLALMDDSGWYRTNPYTGGLFRFGKNIGCDFLNTKCIKDGNTMFNNEFNTKEGDSMCFSGRLTRGISSLMVDSKPVNMSYRYWNDINKGGYEYADYCPVAGDIIYDDYLFGGSCTMGKKSSADEIIGPTSVCFMSSINQIDGMNAICYPSECTSSKFTILVLNKTIECPMNGGNVKIDEGNIVCPEYSSVCSGSIRCGDAIDCVFKKSISKDITISSSNIKIHLYLILIFMTFLK